MIRVKVKAPSHCVLGSNFLSYSRGDEFVVSMVDIKTIQKLTKDSKEHGGRLMDVRSREMPETLIMDENLHLKTKKSARAFRPQYTRHGNGIRFHTHPLHHSPPSPADILAICQEHCIRGDVCSLSMVFDRDAIYILQLPPRCVRAMQAFCKDYPCAAEDDETRSSYLQHHPSWKVFGDIKKQADKIMMECMFEKTEDKSARSYIEKLQNIGVIITHETYSGVSRIANKSSVKHTICIRKK